MNLDQDQTENVILRNNNLFQTYQKDHSFQLLFQWFIATGRYRWFLQIVGLHRYHWFLQTVGLYQRGSKLGKLGF